MKKFNLNDEILVQVTAYGEEYILEKYGKEYWDACIESRKITHEGEYWYKMQAHVVMDTFGGALWIHSHHPIKSNILIPEKNLS